MPKNKNLTSKSGLTLIAVVTLISALAFFTVSASVKSASAALTADELHRRHNAQALLTAESGLMIGTNIFRSGGLSAPITLDLSDSEVVIESTSTGARDGYVRIISTVRHPGLAYDKRVEWQVRVGVVDSVLADSASASAPAAKIAWREVDVPRS